MTAGPFGNKVEPIPRWSCC